VIKNAGINIKLLVRWTIHAVVAGVSGVLIVHSFDWALTFLPAYRGAPLIHPLADAVIAAAVAGLILYRIAPGAAGEGIPAYLDAIRDGDGSLPFLDTLIKYPAALLALGFWGSGGMVGPLGRVTAGLSQAVTVQLQRVFPVFLSDQEGISGHYSAPTTAAIAGMAAAVAAIFGAPIAGAVFAVEVIQRDQMRYHQLFPAILASSTAVLFMKTAGWNPPFVVVVPAYAPEAFALVPIVIVGIASGFMGWFFVTLYRVMAYLFRRRRARGRIYRLVIGMTAAAAIGMLVQDHIFGTSTRISLLLSMGDFRSLSVSWLAGNGVVLLLVLMTAKLLTNCLTVSSGMSAGLTGPAALIGMFVGAVIALLFGYEAGGYTYTALVAAGFAGTLASTVNIPLAASILVMEVFAPEFGLPAGVSAILGFQIARHSTIHEEALENRRAEAALRARVRQKRMDGPQPHRRRRFR